MSSGLYPPAGIGPAGGETLAHVRQLIHHADPDIKEEWKWMGTPVNEAAFKQLIRAAVATNSAALAQRAAKKK